eukprot:TRINITY_DN12258_c0_g1_i1.p1 TRINITY_DN12258_c0_g1~~TRINITY_DN12258_c0_g1_i1.p1  ORF type:complete len:480 (-),score=92.58 TRINITY_DN12258_c0_g1_i1:108-1511(-)
MSQKKETKRSTYASQACDTCRKKHVRCDGNKPCFQCEKRGDQCAYTFKKVKRGPKPKKLKSEDCVSETSSESSYVQNHGDVYGSLQRPPTMGVYGSEDLRQLKTEHIVEALYGFQYRVSSFHPNRFMLDAGIAVDFSGSLITNYVSLLGVDKKLIYSVVIAHGLRMIGQERAAVVFARHADMFYKEMFHADMSEYETITAGTEDQIISALCLLIDFKLQQGEFKSARKCALEAYSLLDSNVDKVPQLLAHRVYSYMAGLSRSKSDISHWIGNACRLGVEVAIPINRVFMSFFHASSGILRENRNNLFSDSINFPTDKFQLSEIDSVHFQEIITQLCDTEEYINQYYAAHSGEQIVEEYTNCCLLVVYACRALIFAQTGSPEKAYLCATKTFQYGGALKGEIVFLLMPLALTYALKVLLALGDFDNFEDGMRYLEVYSNCYPIVERAIKELRHSYISVKSDPSQFAHI